MLQQFGRLSAQGELFNMLVSVIMCYQLKCLPVVYGELFNVLVSVIMCYQLKDIPVLYSELGHPPT